MNVSPQKTTSLDLEPIAIDADFSHRYPAVSHMDSLRPQLAALGFILLLAILAGQAAPQSTASAKLALADRQQFPKEDWPYLYWLDTSPWVGEHRAQLEAAIKFMVCATSTQPIIERTMPAVVPGTPLLRLDIRALGWEYDDWKAVLSTNPYCEGGFTLVTRADWLLVELADMQDSKSGAYMRLLFGGKNPPKTRDDVFQRLGVGNAQQHIFGLIEGDSGVAVRKGGRVIESRPIQRGYAYLTRDVLRLTADRNPLENLQSVVTGQSQHDGEEIICMLPKFSETTGERGTLPFYFLADGAGNLVNRAPVDLVVDTKQFRGFHEIRVPGACFVSCHSAGFNQPTENEFRELTKDGVFPFVNDQQKATEIRAYMLSQLTKEIQRANEDQQTITALITGLAHDDLSTAFKGAVDRYDAPLRMQQVAEEFTPYGWQAQEVVAAVELSANEGRIGPTLAGIARNREVDREALEEGWLTLLGEIQRWDANN